MTIANTASSMVAGRRVLMTLMTGSAYLNDLPKSPAAADCEKFPVLDVKRLVEAPALFCLAISAALVSSPSRSKVGSPGAAWIRKKPIS